MSLEVGNILHTFSIIGVWKWSTLNAWFQHDTCRLIRVLGCVYDIVRLSVYNSEYKVKYSDFLAEFYQANVTRTVVNLMCHYTRV